MSNFKIKGLTKLYKGDKGIKDLSFSIESGDILLLLGPNGAGKTTAIRGILGLTHTDSKEVYFDHKDVTNNPVEFLKSTGAMVSKPVFYEYMTGYEQLKMIAEFYDHVDNKRILTVLDDVDLIEDKDKKIAEYSTGMKQRLDFARAIMHEPELLILDEPFNGMDIEKKANLKQFIKYLSEKKDVSIIISSHMVGDLSQLANRVLIINEANTLYDGPMSEATKEQTLEDFYLDRIREGNKLKGGQKSWMS